MIKKIVILMLLIAALVGTYMYLQSNRDNLNLNLSPLTFSNSDNSFAFEELTIPYLRERKYESNLNELNLLSQNSSYTSYLTSYNSDGLKINGLLTVPKGEKPIGGFPAIVFVHGYIPPTLYETTEKYVAYVDSLAKSGFVVFKIDLRGHGDSEGDASGSYYSGDYVIDTLNAYSALQNSDLVNPNRVGLWGHSMAGNVTFRSIAAKKDIPSLVVWAGAGFTYSDLIEYRINDNSYRPPTDNTERQNKRRQLMEYYGQFDPSSWFWKQVVPTNYLDEVVTKVQIHHAADDDVVSVNYSRNLNSILDREKIMHEYYEYPQGGHNISGSAFNSAIERTIKFFKDSLI